LARHCGADNVIPATQEAEVGGSQSETNLQQKHKTLSEKQIKAKGLGGMAQVADFLLSKSKALSSIPST
jgi:hypothetical protein